ncbi:MAG: IS66 family transposase [Elusimicrobia bacterium]|nr:IS66 family transposase [Elusimicrobiota bacterium]
MMRVCAGCLEKQRRIDALEEAVGRLKAKLRYQARCATEGVFGSSTPSSKIPVKRNTLPERQARRGGARPGHVGHGRSAASEASADRIETLRVPTQRCPTCQGRLTTRGFCRRTVIEIPPTRPQTILYRLEVKHCPRCRRTVRAHAPAVLPKALYGNELLTQVATQHYVHGVPLGRIEDHLGLGIGSVIGALHRVAQLVAPVEERLLQEYRHAPVKHADETGWRTDDHNGYVWLFATTQISLFRFRQTRSAAVPQAVFGTQRLPGVLLVDRYQAYNQLRCALQYCYAHLLRDVNDLAQECPQSAEVQAFSYALAPLLSEAMGLRSASISRAAFQRQARRVKRRILAIVQHAARHPGIQRLQDIFRVHTRRVYHWATDRNIPAENNLAERDLRPSVIARKVSFGSQSEAGARMRETLMTVLCTLRKRFPQNFARRFKHALDTLAIHPTRDPYGLLFHDRPPP